MGRRSLRKLPQHLDYSRWYRTAEQMLAGWDAAALFAQPEQPLEVELGSGKGLFMASTTVARPDVNFLGLELALKYAQHAAAKLSRLQVANGVMVSGDGLRIFREVLPTEQVAAVHVYFPDPWWKKRHKKRRVVNYAFLQDVVRVLVPHGKLHLWTDVQEYFETSLELIRHTPLAGPFEVDEPPSTHDLDYRTHFERRTRQNGQPVYRAEYRKPSGELVWPNPPVVAADSADESDDDSPS